MRPCGASRQAVGISCFWAVRAIVVDHAVVPGGIVAPLSLWKSKFCITQSVAPIVTLTLLPESGFPNASVLPANLIVRTHASHSLSKTLSAIKKTALRSTLPVAFLK